MLDESCRYVDHIDVREGRRRTRVANLARHSGDPFPGDPFRGDVEFIDLQLSHAPSEVRMILLGAIYVRSHGKRSIVHPPNSYLRLQNRTWRRPIAFEVDRWELNPEEERGNSKTPLACALLLGMLVHTGNTAGEGISSGGFPAEEGLSPARTTPVFEFIPVHQQMPVDPRKSVSGVLPLVQWAAAYLSRRGRLAGLLRSPARTEGETEGEGGETPTRELPVAFDSHGGVDFVDGCVSPEVGGFPADWQARLTAPFAVELRVVELLSVRPRMPDRFRCHVEAWVYSGGGSALNRGFKSAFLGNAENLLWDPDAEPAVFLVHMFDRLRVFLYEHAAGGYGDVDLLRIPGLWQAGEGGVIELVLPLVSGSPLFEGKIRLHLRQVPVKSVYPQIRKRWKRVMKRQAAHHEEIQRREDQRHNRAFHLCTMM
ncbi:unnamed protein product [Phytomonas sp. EM1]|nr:unnamed protein product [Phytomonas sp. EM1]|eukprot:CCW65525.1 unnamed protein product [Phytomonas sp. isolate EM1]